MNAWRPWCLGVLMTAFAAAAVAAEASDAVGVDAGTDGAAASLGDDVVNSQAMMTGEGVRLKDLVTIAGVRDNQLHGVGIVVGLQGTGDGTESTLRMIRQLLANKHLSFSTVDLESENVAMVTVTADLPAFARNGTRIPVQIAAIGDAESLRGGVLLQTPLVAADGRIYAVGQGPVVIGGFGDAGPGLVDVGRGHTNIETVATLGEGAIVEREVPTTLLYGDRLRLLLRDPDFTTAHEIARVLATSFDPEMVEASDAASVTLRFESTPTDTEIVAAIAQLEHLRVTPDARARVVVNSRTGTVVVGAEVMVTRAAVSHGGLSLHIRPGQRRVPDPNDPERFINQDVWIDQITGLATEEPPPGVVPADVAGGLNLVEGTSVEEIANALNALGARPRDLVAIFRALHRAGALHAELVVM